MKKLFLSILVICSLLGGNAYAEEKKVKHWNVVTVSYSNLYQEKIDKWGDAVGQSRISFEDAKKQSFDKCSKLYNDCILQSIERYYSLNAMSVLFRKNIEIEYVWEKEKVKYAKTLKEKKLQEKKISQQNEQTAIMFTIKDKREQCEAIGFKPKTEKFADCVLRLVELDVKKQQSEKIAIAQNSGNDALVKQLERQNQIQSSQALLNLSQQLVQPNKSNSNIYMPQTQSCTVQNNGSISNITCR